LPSWAIVAITSVAYISIIVPIIESVPLTTISITIPRIITIAITVPRIIVAVARIAPTEMSSISIAPSETYSKGEARTVTIIRRIIRIHPIGRIEGTIVSIITYGMIKSPNTSGVGILLIV